MIHKEKRMSEKGQQLFHPVIRILAHIVSYIFHPLFVPVYIGWFLIYVLWLFPEQDPRHRPVLLLQFLVNYTILPLASILLMKALGFISSLQLKTQRDRILPYVICEIFYFWVWYVFKNQHYPKEAIMLGLGIFLASCIGLILNSYSKVSMHSISAGVISTFILITGLNSSQNVNLFIAVIIFLSGLVCSARLITASHQPVQVYLGFFGGITAQLVSYFFV